MASNDIQDRLRRLPGVDILLGKQALALLPQPKSVIKKAIVEVLDFTRQAILNGEPTITIDETNLIDRIIERVESLDAPHFQKVINATGVVIHTNLGRSLLPKSALEAVVEYSSAYTNLEFDVETGSRGSRYSHVVGALKELTGAEAALVVNNNAAAVLVALNTLGMGREVIVSRGQLVEIGGAFRIPEVMARSGAILREVGATNKTHIRDYDQAINENTAGLLKVHQSNFAMIGFQQIVPLTDMVELGRQRGLWVMDDLGSGCLVDLSRFGLTKEPTVSECLDHGADVVTFSGDKLLGGPQAGIILGREEIITQIQKNPINRAVRIDKMTLAALEAVLRLYRDQTEAAIAIPTLSMLRLDYPTLRRKANGLRRRLMAAGGRVVECRVFKDSSQVGGGSMPLQTLPTALVGLKVSGRSAFRLEEAFRNPEAIDCDLKIPIIGRIVDDWLAFDPRTLQAGDSAIIGRTLELIVRELTGDSKTEFPR